MSYEGIVQQGVVVFNAGQGLPEGTPVRIVPRREPSSAAPESSDRGIWDDLVKLAREVEDLPCDLPEDLARNHDHYLYGVPKRQ